MQPLTAALLSDEVENIAENADFSVLTLCAYDSGKCCELLGPTEHHKNVLKNYVVSLRNITPIDSIRYGSHHTNSQRNVTEILQITCPLLANRSALCHSYLCADGNSKERTTEASGDGRESETLRGGAWYR